MHRNGLIFIFCLFTSLALGQSDSTAKDMVAWNLAHAGGLTQPTLVSVTTNTSAAAGSTFTTSAVSASGGNYMLIAVAFAPGSSRTISSITTGTGAQSATNIVTASYQGATTGKVALYGVVNPTTGDVVCTLSGTGINMTMVTMLFNNVGGSGATGSGNAGSDFSGSARTSTSDGLTTVSTDLAVDALAFNGGADGITKGGSQTLVAENTGTTTASLACSTQPGSAGTTTMSWTMTSQLVTWVGVALNGK